MSLAEYKLEMSVTGMNVPGLAEGVGDRRLTFTMNFDGEVPEQADALFYGHLHALTDDAQVTRFTEGFPR